MVLAARAVGAQAVRCADSLRGSQHGHALAALASLAACGALAQPQPRPVPQRIRRIAVFFFGTPANSRTRREAFAKGMLDSYNVICMLLLIAVFLILTLRRLDAARLRG